MKFEVVEEDLDGGDWVVRRDGVEVSRHREQEHALAEIAERLRGERQSEPDLSYSLTMRYLARA